MIPKIIHYTWFSGEPFPANIANCIESWERFMPDYELRLWDMESIKDIDSEFLREALKERKWAYAADYVRLYAVYNHGGIYLDSDAKIFKSLDPFLEDKAFIGKEMSMHINGPSQEMYLSSHCFGAEKGNEFIGKCLSYYDDRRFITSPIPTLPPTLRLNLVLLPYIQSEIAKTYGYDPRPLAQTIQLLDTVTVYPSEYFDSIKLGKNSYCKHLALGSWREGQKREWKYSFMYKIQWRLWAIVEKTLRCFNRIVIKLR